MSDRTFPGLPKTSEEAFAKAQRLHAFMRSGLQESRPDCPPFPVQASRLRRLGAWLAEREFEAASAAAERRATASFARFETNFAEAW